MWNQSRLQNNHAHHWRGPVIFHGMKFYGFKKYIELIQRCCWIHMTYKIPLEFTQNQNLSLLQSIVYLNQGP
jgi:hypothetical protein